MSDTDGAPTMIVPAYFHPALRGADWLRLSGCAGLVSTVVINMADGPGTFADDAFDVPLERLRDAGIELAGYVDTAYGARRHSVVLDEFERYQRWYGVESIFLDRVRADWDGLGYYCATARFARDAGAESVIFNHGTHPVEGYVEHADRLGTFEGDWRAYGDLRLPQWVSHRPAEHFFHLVYSLPVARRAEALALARQRNVGSVFLTERGGRNPWDRLPEVPSGLMVAHR